MCRRSRCQPGGAYERPVTTASSPKPRVTKFRTTAMSTNQKVIATTLPISGITRPKASGFQLTAALKEIRGPLDITPTAVIE